MTRTIILSMLTAFCSLNMMAQDDDMYFTSSKKAKNDSRKAITSEVVDEDAPNRYRIPATESDDAYDNDGAETPSYYSGTLRSVDEYNRRDRFNSNYARHLQDSLAVEDSILVSRRDFENSQRMQRFDGYRNTVIVVNDPWDYDPYYYDVYYHPWRRSLAGWIIDDLLFDPWYYGYHGWGYPYHAWNSWGWHVGYGYHGWYGGIGWGGHWGGWYPHHGWARSGYTYTRGGFGSGRNATINRMNRNSAVTGGSASRATAGRSIRTNSFSRTNSNGTVVNGQQINGNVSRNNTTTTTTPSRNSFQNNTSTRSNSFGGASRSSSNSFGGGSSRPSGGSFGGGGVSRPSGSLGGGARSGGGSRVGRM